MDSIHIRQNARPLRYGFIIPDGDLQKALMAVSLNSAIWGGVFNPIVSLRAHMRDAILNEFDPDLLVDLTDGALDERLRSQYERRVISEKNLRLSDWRSGKLYLHLGVDVLPLLTDIHQREVRFSQAPSRAILVALPLGDPWEGFAAFLYGSFKHLPTVALD